MTVVAEDREDSAEKKKAHARGVCAFVSVCALNSRRSAHRGVMTVRLSFNVGR